jgi:hypothetical protein
VLFSEAEFCRGEQPIDDIVAPTQAIIDELGLPVCPLDKERRRLALGKTWWKFDEDLCAIIERTDGPPWRAVPFDPVMPLDCSDADVETFCNLLVAKTIETMQHKHLAHSGRERVNQLPVTVAHLLIFYCLPLFRRDRSVALGIDRDMNRSRRATPRTVHEKVPNDAVEEGTWLAHLMKRSCSKETRKGVVKDFVRFVR